VLIVRFKHPCYPKDIQYQCPVYFFAAGVSYTKLALDSLDSEFLKSLRLSA